MPDLASTPTIISASGSGVAAAEPDRVLVSCTASKVRATPRAALDEVTELANRVVDALVAVGVDRSTLVASPGHIGQQFRHENGQSVLEGWQAQFAIRTNLDDPTILHAVLESLASVEDLAIDPPRWTIAPENPVWAEARRAAVADALGIARELAAAADLAPGRVVSITDGRGSGGPTREFAGRAMMRASAAPPDHGLETVSVSASVTIEAGPA